MKTSTDASKPVIDVLQVFYSYDGLEDVLTSVTFEVYKGEHVCILGRNGSGKSTLSRMLNALVIPDEGEVLVNELETDDPDNAIEIRRHVGMVFQNPDDQMVTSVVEDDIAFGPENLGVPRLEIKKRIDEALTAVDMLEHKTDNPNQLSGGQKQRVAIAGTLAMLPEIIVLDEPTAMLDPQGREEIRNEIVKLSDKGYTIIHITHSMEEALLADRIIVLTDGFVSLDATPSEIFSSTNKILQLGLEKPFVLDLSIRLKNAGLDITPTIEEDKLLEALCQ